jgi:PmbA protein
VSAQQSHFWAGNSRGFRGGYASSRHYVSVSPIAGKGKACSATPGTASMRDAADLAAPEAVGRYAAERALSRLKARRVPTAEVPVLFENTVAAGLLGSLVQATSGGALYRKASFLLDSLGQPVLADTSTSTRTRTPKGKGSAPFRRRGRAHARAPRGRRPAWCRATSCPATRRASWA